jgi:hypothetical protein
MNKEDPKVTQAQSDRFREAAKIAGGMDSPELFIASLKAIVSKDDQIKEDNDKRSPAEGAGR